MMRAVSHGLQYSVGNPLFT